MAGLFGRTEEQSILHDVVHRFVRDDAPFEQRHRRLEHARMALWPALADLGVLGAGIAESLGGLGATMRDVAVVQDALAPGLLVEPVLAAAVAGRLLSHAPDQERETLGTLIAGETVIILAHCEGFDPYALPEMPADAVNGSYRLRGQKACIRHADVATDYLVSARLPDRTIGVFRVSATAPGLSADVTRLIDGAGAADLRFDTVAVDAPIAFDCDAMSAVADALDWGLAGLCAETAALTAVANRATFDYLNTRQQFGSRLAGFQALRHRAADMAICHEEAAAMAELAIEACTDSPSSARRRVILAASLACDAAGRHVAHESVQMFGGMGVSDETPISHYARRLAAIRTEIGTRDARAAALTALVSTP